MDRYNASGKGAVYLAWFQGIYYAVAGIWPILHIDSFMMVTGPKTDIWLVHTVGLLLVAVGVVLCLAAYRRRLTLEMIVLAAGTALALTWHRTGLHLERNDFDGVSSGCGR